MIPLLSKNKHFQGEEETLFWEKGWTTIHYSFSNRHEALGNYFKISVTGQRQTQLKPQEDHDHTI